MLLSCVPHTLIINTTPLGMYPKIEDCPALPYEAIGPLHYLFDLVYNPSETLFLQKGAARGAVTENGYEMLIGQAEESWRIWNAENATGVLPRRAIIRPGVKNAGIFLWRSIAF